MQSDYKTELIKKHSPKSRVFHNGALAFLFGGGICVAGEVLRMLFTVLGADGNTAGILVTLSLISAAAILTGLGAFDKIARHSGAGTLVPVTGFANAVVSEAMDSSGEGYILGVGTKIFTVAGPVILYGTAAGAIYGVIYYFTLFLP